MSATLAWLREPELRQAAQATAMVAVLLARNSGPATLLFEELADEPILIEMTGQAERELTVAEHVYLHAGPGMRAVERTGVLRTVRSGLAVASVSSVVIPARLPGTALSDLGIPSAANPEPAPSGIPLGKALAGLGVRREPLGVRLARDPEDTASSENTVSSGGTISIEASARMWLGDTPVAVASERVTTEFCRQAAVRLGAWQ